MEGHPALNVAVCCLYVGAIAASTSAWRQASKYHRPPRERRIWLYIAGFFLAILIWRALGLEDLVRNTLRAWLRGDGDYDRRRTLQAPFVAVTIPVAVAACSYLVWKIMNGWRDALQSCIRLAWLAIAAMLGMIAARLISFHALDSLLYGGPHFNWLVDPGATLLSMYAAWRYRYILAHWRPTRRVRQSLN